MFNDTSSTLALLRSRRSGKARNMVEPGPDAAQLADILAIATRVPDHGKLAPWRFVVIDAAQRDRFADLLTTAYRAERPGAGRLELEAMEAFAHFAPTLVAMLFTPVGESKIPLWEQQLSMGAAAMQLLNAAHAHGYVANWLTGWPAQSQAVAAALGGDGPHDRIAGFVFMGTAAKALEERPRPEKSQVIRNWQGK